MNDMQVIPAWVDKFRKVMPVEEDFHALEIANAVYPHCVKYDTEGRLSNKALPTVTRLLRRTKLIMEVDNRRLIFWADKHFFKYYSPR
jgi:hypothetical protein